MPAARRVFFKNGQLRVQVIGERNREEKQDQGANESGPLAPLSVATFARLTGPAHAPEVQSRQGQHDPQKIEKRLHSHDPQD
jgi:hypothetical protein